MGRRQARAGSAIGPRWNSAGIPMGKMDTYARQRSQIRPKPWCMVSPMKHALAYPIAGNTAIHHWLNCDTAATPMRKQAANRLFTAAATLPDVEMLGESSFGPPPYEVLVPRASARGKNPHFHFLVHNAELPAESLVRIGRHTAICSPAFSFYQASHSLSLTEAIELGTNLCGSYWLDWLGNIQERHEPLITADKLRSFLDENSSLYGSKHACKAASFIRSGSASPMETKLLLILALPMRLGGFGLEDACFNFQVNPGKARCRTEQSFFKIDIAFPDKKVGIEFDGEAFHRDFAKDRRRINALESLGWRIVSVDKYQLYNEARMERTVDQIGRLLGVRIRRRGDWAYRHALLRQELLLS